MNLKGVGRLVWFLRIFGGIVIAAGIYTTFASLEFFSWVIMGVVLIGIGEVISLICTAIERSLVGDCDKASNAEKSTPTEQEREKERIEILKAVTQKHPEPLTPEQLGKLIEEERRARGLTDSD